MATLAYGLAGVFGYVYAVQETCGNILSNFAPTDTLAMICRCALTCVLTLNIPLLVMPSRDSFYSLMKFAKRCVSPDLPSSPEDSPPGTLTHKSHGSPGESPRGSPQGSRVASNDDMSSVAAYVTKSPRAKPQLFDQFVPHDVVFLEAMQDKAAMSVGLQVVLSVAILASAATFACLVKSVLTVWGILGSAVVTFVMVVQPPLWWNAICRNSVGQLKRSCAVLLSAVATVLAVICTVLTILRLNDPSCPGAN